MASSATTVVMQGPSPEDDFGLDIIAQHNAVASTEQFPPYEDSAKGLGIYNDGIFQDSYTQNPLTPRSNTAASEGVRTRSGRSTRGRTDSPFSSRISKSPAAKSKPRPSKLDKSKTPKLTAPLSVLTKDLDVPMKDMDAWVHRPAEVRREEVSKRNGYVTRPMNSFMLYRSCYADRTKAWCVQNNHQVVSSVSGESWPMEPEEVRNQFNEWAKIERENHAKAHPEYKFSPSKTGNKRKKGEVSDDEDDASDLGGDPDGEYHGGSRSVRQKRHQQQPPPVPYVPSNVGFDSHPYFGQPYEQQHQHFGYTSEARPLPSNVGYDASGLAYNPQTGRYVHTTVQHQQQQYGYLPSNHRVATPNSMASNQGGLGGYGLPSGTDDLFSRTVTPQQNQYQQFYPQYTPQQTYQQLPNQQQQQQMYEHQQYLQQALQPQTAIDPGLEAKLAVEEAAGQGHFEDALEDFGVDRFFEEPGSAGFSSWTNGEMGGQ